MIKTFRRTTALIEASIQRTFSLKMVQYSWSFSCHRVPAQFLSLEYLVSLWSLLASEDKVIPRRLRGCVMRSWIFFFFFLFTAQNWVWILGEWIITVNNKQNPLQNKDVVVSEWLLTYHVKVGILFTGLFPWQFQLLQRLNLKKRMKKKNSIAINRMSWFKLSV